MKLFNPEQIGGKLANAAFSVGGGEFLFVIEEGSGKTAFGIIMHLVGANLEFDDLFIVSDYGGVERLVAILFGHGDIVFNATVHRMKKGMNNAEDEITSSCVVYDKAQGDNIVDTIDILVVFREFFVQGINGFDATVAFVVDMFLLERLFDGGLGGSELFVGFFEAVGGEILKLLITARVNIAEAGLFDFDPDAAHLEAVGKRRKNFERFASNFLLFLGRQSAERAQIVQAVGEFNNEYANVLASRDEKL